VLEVPLYHAQETKCTRLYITKMTKTIGYFCDRSQIQVQSIITTKKTQKLKLADAVRETAIRRILPINIFNFCIINYNSPPGRNPYNHHRNDPAQDRTQEVQRAFTNQLMSPYAPPCTQSVVMLKDL